MTDEPRRALAERLREAAALAERNDLYVYGSEFWTLLRDAADAIAVHQTANSLAITSVGGEHGKEADAAGMGSDHGGSESRLGRGNRERGYRSDGVSSDQSGNADIPLAADALAAVPAEAQYWQLIETAPKVRDRRYLGVWLNEDGQQEVGAICWGGLYWWHENETVKPTHWMPLPEPPQ